MKAIMILFRIFIFENFHNSLAQKVYISLHVIKTFFFLYEYLIVPAVINVIILFSSLNCYLYFP